MQVKHGLLREEFKSGIKDYIRHKTSLGTFESHFEADADAKHNGCQMETILQNRE
jgi:hypothetical protein